MRTNLNNIQWCPGCWDFMVLAAIKKAFTDLWIKSSQRVIVSGIWCSWKISQYIDWYAWETLHGRALPFATWVKIAKPDMHVIVIWWDWDGFWIWMWHFVHAARRNINITYLVLNNQNYWLTTGQASPSTPIWAKTKTTPTWNELSPINPVELAKISWAKFAKNASDSDLKNLVETIKEAIKFDWFSFVDINQACPSFRKWD